MTVASLESTPLMCTWNERSACKPWIQPTICEYTSGAASFLQRIFGWWRQKLKLRQFISPSSPLSMVFMIVFNACWRFLRYKSPLNTQKLMSLTFVIKISITAVLNIIMPRVPDVLEFWVLKKTWQVVEDALSGMFLNIKFLWWFITYEHLRLVLSAKIASWSQMP